MACARAADKDCKPLCREMLTCSRGRSNICSFQATGRVPPCPRTASGCGGRSKFREGQQGDSSARTSAQKRGSAWVGWECHRGTALRAAGKFTSGQWVFCLRSLAANTQTSARHAYYVLPTNAATTAVAAAITSLPSQRSLCKLHLIVTAELR